MTQVFKMRLLCHYWLSLTCFYTIFG